MNMTTVDRIMVARVSRRGLLKGIGAASLGLSLGSGMLGKGPLLRRTSLLHAAAQDSESVQDITNIAITAEALAITLLGGAIATAQSGGYDMPLSADVIGILQAARAEEQFHYDFLEQAGGVPLTTTFTIPDPALLSSTTTLFTTLVTLETAFVAAYMAAGREFAAMDNAELVQYAFEIANVEAQHRVLANYALGTRPAVDYAFYPALFDTVGDAATALTDLGFIGGTGTQVMYPGPGDIDDSNVSNTEPTGPSVTCVVTPGGGTDPRDPVPPMDGCQYFDQTGHNLCQPFLDFWNHNGGLDVFGYPLTEAFQEQNFDTGQTYLTQYFERQRFEWHPENAGTVYETLLGRMGVEILVIQGRDWHSFPTANSSAPHYFSETGHAIAPEFWEYWSSHGLDYGDDGMSFRESLLLFGYPISEPAMETNADGDNVLTQWFERAVFELHPGNSAQYTVLLRRLGAEFLDTRGS
jgi:hypothetical protein